MDGTVTAWAGADVQRDTSPPPAAPVTNWERQCVTLAGYCYVVRHGMKVQLVTPYRVSLLQRYGVTVRGNVTSVYPPLHVKWSCYRSCPWACVLHVTPFRHCVPQNADCSVRNVAVRRQVTGKQALKAKRLTVLLFPQPDGHNHRPSKVTHTVQHDSLCMGSHVLVTSQSFLQPCSHEIRSMTQNSYTNPQGSCPQSQG